MILILDNYDSFTYNIYQAVSTLDPEVMVMRNDELTPDELEKMPLSHMVISPGPGRPDGAGISKEAIRRMAGKVPIDRKSTRLNSSHIPLSRMPSSA